MKARHLLSLFLPLFVVACSPKTDSKDATDTTSGKSVSADGTSTTGSADATTGTTAATTTGSTGGTQEPSKPTASLADIPDALKSDAYYYYGLSNTQPMSMKVEISDQPGNTLTGTQTISLKEVKDGKPIFSIDRTGGLSKLGSQEIRLDADGIYNTMSTIAKVGQHDLELPAKLTPGVTWKSHAEISQGPEVVINDSVFTVVGPDKAKTEAGEHDALLITSTGRSTIQNRKAKTTSKNWYVKDLGTVKSVLTNTYADNGKVQTITIQETK